MPKKAIIIIAVLFVALVAGAVYFLVIKGDTKEAGPEPVVFYNYAIADSFVTNVKDSSKLFKTTVVLVLNKAEMDTFIKENQYTVRDTILFILRDLTEEDIKSSDIQDKLRISIPQALNAALKIDNIVSVYFSDFVMQ
jgi:flagellar basal body-associated protein FliL